jgi:nucleoside-diphosphate-sugar epimerase
MIFVLGGNGLLGSAFVRVLEARNLPHAVITRDNYGSFSGQSCDLFINANGNSRKPLARQDPLAEFDASVRSVRQTLIDFPSRRYLHLSSCDVYPDCSSPHFTHEDTPIDPALQSAYGFHKRLAELCVQHAHADWFIFRLGGFVGPGLKKNAIFDILQGGPLWLDPQSELQFLHTSDAARIMLALAQSEAIQSRQIFNLSGRGVIRLQDVIDSTGQPVAVNPNSPCVRYDVNIEKISRIMDIPDTRSAVLRFVASALPERPTATA